MGNTLGSSYRVQLFGQSHSPAIGCIIEGLPAGFTPDREKLRAFMARRAPGRGELSTTRREADEIEILSGLNEKGETCGAPLCVRIANTDAKGADYEKLRDVPRPGHADYTAWEKYGGHNDIRGGGQFSGRLTAPICCAGALAMQLLEKAGIRICAHIYAIDGVRDTPFDPMEPLLSALPDSGLPVLNPAAGAEMERHILSAKAEGDSVGGIIECAAAGLPAGLGEPLFDSVESRLSAAYFSVPAVRGVEFGLGFEASALRGSRHNDAYRMEDGKVVTATNRCGGVLGGVTTGLPLLARVAFKPTPSIAKEQQSVSLSRGENALLSVGGRHDPCIVPRAVPVIEAMTACVLLDLWEESKKAKLF